MTPLVVGAGGRTLADVAVADLGALEAADEGGTPLLGGGSSQRLEVIDFDLDHEIIEARLGAINGPHEATGPVVELGRSAAEVLGRASTLWRSRNVFGRIGDPHGRVVAVGDDRAVALRRRTSELGAVLLAAGFAVDAITEVADGTWVYFDDVDDVRRLVRVAGAALAPTGGWLVSASITADLGVAAGVGINWADVPILTGAVRTYLEKMTASFAAIEAMRR